MYKNGDHIYSFMAGPTFSARIKRVTPFAHWLIGGASSCGSCDNAFAMAVGGGFDVNANDHFAIRVGSGLWQPLAPASVAHELTSNSVRDKIADPATTHITATYDIALWNG